MADTSSKGQYPEQFFAIIACLNNEGVRYVVIGGVAMVLQGSSHLTRDIDIFYDREPQNIERLVAAILPHRPRLRGLSDEVPFIFDERSFRFALNFTLITDLGDIDLLADVPGATSFSEVYERATNVDLDLGSIRVSSIVDLIAMKKKAGRPKDIAHLMELEALFRLTSE